MRVGTSRKARKGMSDIHETKLHKDDDAPAPAAIDRLDGDTNQERQHGADT